MGKLQVISGKQTNWGGLWWHPENNSFSSQALSLSELRKFKGYVRLYVKKNKYFNGGENGRPNYQFTLRDASSENALELSLEDVDAEEMMALLAGYIEKHPLAVDNGSDYIMQDGDAQADAVQLVCDIFDNMSP